MIYVEEGEDVYVTKTVYSEKTGLPTRQITTLNGYEHAPPDGSPSQIAYDEQGRPTHKFWHAFGLEHRTDGPAAIVLYPENGVHKTEVFKIEGQPRQPEHGPYQIRRDRNGDVWKQDFATEADRLPVHPPRQLEP